MKRLIRYGRSMKGFTLVELMVVLAIIGVLAAIVVPAVSGTREVSKDSQAKSDGGVGQSKIGEFFGDQQGAEVITTSTVSILGVSVTQKTSSNWPEKTIKAGYSREFPDTATATIAAVNIKNKDGTTKTPKQLAESYTSVDFGRLVPTTGATYLDAVPVSADLIVDVTVDTTTLKIHSYLWVLLKTTPTGGAADSGRTLKIYKLTKADVNESTKLATLNYEELF